MSAVRRKERRDTSTHWAATTVPLGAGELGIELDNVTSAVIGMRVGDGSTLWGALPAASIFDSRATASSAYATPATAQGLALVQALIFGS